MKFGFLGAAAVAAFMAVSAGSALAGNFYELSTSKTSGVPTLAGGDEGLFGANGGLITTTTTFALPLYFDTGTIGKKVTLSATINSSPFTNQPQITGMSTTFYDITGGGNVNVGTITGGSGAVQLASNQKYEMVVSATAVAPGFGQYEIGLQTAPVPEASAWVMAIFGVGMIGGVAAWRRRSQGMAVAA